jgi:hypothetical protein
LAAEKRKSLAPVAAEVVTQSVAARRVAVQVHVMIGGIPQHAGPVTLVRSKSRATHAGLVA